MTVLVDEARWEWSGERWAHLVSDESYDELHELASSIGKRRLGFQGDHYDVVALDRERAVEAGAVAVHARELVTRLRASGLRRRDAKPAWREIARSAPGASIEAMLRSAAGSGAMRAGMLGRVRRGVEALDGLSRAAGVVVLHDRRHVVALFDVPAGVDRVDRTVLDGAADEIHVSGLRADGSHSVELFHSR